MLTMHNVPLLEVIACSVSDAIEAERGGAGRLEIVRDLNRGGLTPALTLVKEIKQQVAIPVRVMLRESDGFEVSDEDEIKRLCNAANAFASLGVDGLVLGFLKNGIVDVDLTQKVLAFAPNLKATFHHAFESAADQHDALRQIKSLWKIDRVLSHGGGDDLESRIGRLAKYQEEAGPELTILAGGRVDANAIARIGAATAIREFHVGRAARCLFQVEGDVQAPLVSQLVNTLKELR